MAGVPGLKSRVAEIVSTMRRGGYYEAVMSAGPELGRVKRFLKILAGEARPVKAPAELDPEFLPVFPGVSNEPVHARGKGDPAVRLASRFLKRLQAEARSLDRESFIEAEVCDDHGESVAERRRTGYGWRILPLYTCGTRLPLAKSCPAAAELVEKLPGAAPRWPFSSVMYSELGPRTRLGRHRSTDMLRLRCHVPLQVPEGGVLSVAGRDEAWSEGRVLFFNDAFWHDAANDSDRPRVILIIDTWHPELTPAEIAALEAGFRKLQVRRIIYDFDLKEMVWESGMRSWVDAMFLEAFEREDEDPAIRRFWKPGF